MAPCFSRRLRLLPLTVRFWDPDHQRWVGDCPQDMQNLFATFKKQTAVGGGFVYELDLIRDTIKNIPVRGTGCTSQDPRYAYIYLQYLKAGLGVARVERSETRGRSRQR